MIQARDRRRPACVDDRQPQHPADGLSALTGGLDGNAARVNNAQLGAVGGRFRQPAGTQERADLLALVLVHFAAERSGRILLAPLIKNIIWQAYERIRDGTEPPIGGNIRTFFHGG